MRETMFKLILMWILEENNVTQWALSSIYNSSKFSEFANSWKQEVKHNTIVSIKCKFLCLKYSEVYIIFCILKHLLIAILPPRSFPLYLIQNFLS
jgi:hypothetical protein